MNQARHTNAQRPTLKSVAEAAGVDASTVSRALREEVGSRIPPATVERIKQVAQEQGYEVNPWARSLRTQRSMILGLAVPRLTDIVLAQMFEATQERARAHGYDTITVSDNGTDPWSAIERLVERRVDGLILATSTEDTRPLDHLAERNVPFILLNRTEGSHPAVRGDDEVGGYLATQHLIEQGHRSVAHLAGPQQASTARLRLAGYRRAMVDVGLEDDVRAIEVGGFSIQDAMGGADRLLKEHNPEAVFCVNDASAIALMACAKRRGLRVPDDLAVIGYNDTEIAALLPISLSTIRLPLLTMGATAADLLIDLLDGHEVSSLVVQPELMVRESSTSVR